jgi:hypothetical protein
MHDNCPLQLVHLTLERDFNCKVDSLSETQLAISRPGRLQVAIIGELRETGVPEAILSAALASLGIEEAEFRLKLVAQLASSSRDLPRTRAA